MKPLLFSFFGIFTSLRTAVVLFVLLTADLLIAWYCLVGNAIFYEPMNQIGLWRWLTTFGRDEPALSAWFVIFAVLLFLLVVNTLICTCDRLPGLLSLTAGPRRFRERILPLQSKRSSCKPLPANVRPLPGATSMPPPILSCAAVTAVRYGKLLR